MLWNKARDKDKDKDKGQQQQGICQYCLEHNNNSTTVTIPAYYKHGHALRLVNICKSCQDFESETLGLKLGFRSAAETHRHDDYALEAICQVIRRITVERWHTMREGEAMAKALPLLTAYDYVYDPERVKALTPSYGVVPLNYYKEAVRTAYSESADLRNYLNCSIEEIDKDLKSLWPLTYRLIHELPLGRPSYSLGILEILNMDLMGNPKSDDLKVRWAIFALTPMELAEQERLELMDKRE